MIAVREFIDAGWRHRSDGLACQDRVGQSRRGNIEAIALADGTGSSDFGALGAQTAADTIADYLTANFDRLYDLEKSQLQYALIVTIRQALYVLCGQWDVAVDELGSTCLAVAVDHGSGRFLCAHLGDGCIAVRQADRYRIISYPKNGISGDYTRLTTSNPAAPHLAVTRGQMVDISGFCLLSDGWRKEQGEESGMLCAAIDALNRGKVERHHIDDLGAVCLGKFL